MAEQHALGARGFAFSHDGAAAYARRPTIRLLDPAARAGGDVVGVVSGISGQCHLTYTCEERCAKLMFADQKDLATVQRDTSPLRATVVAHCVMFLTPDPNGFASFSFSIPEGAPPNFIGMHDAVHHTLVYTASHILVLSDEKARELARLVMSVVPSYPADGMDKSCPDSVTLTKDMWVLPRMARSIGGLLAKKPAVFNVEVPCASAVLAGRHLYVNMSAVCGVAPRSLKLSIHRTMTIWTSGPPCRTVAERSQANSIPDSILSSTHRVPSIHSSVMSSMTHSAPLRALERADSGSQRGRSVKSEGMLGTTRSYGYSDDDDGMPSVQVQRTALGETVTLRTTVQRFSVVKPFPNSFEGSYYVLVPKRCCSFSSDMVNVSYHLNVKLKFGMGRVMHHTVPLNIRHWQSESIRGDDAAKPAPGEWHNVFETIHETATDVPLNCPLCFQRLLSQDDYSQCCPAGTHDRLYVRSDSGSTAAGHAGAASATPGASPRPKLASDLCHLIDTVEESSAALVDSSESEAEDPDGTSSCSSDDERDDVSNGSDADDELSRAWAPACLPGHGDSSADKHRARSALSLHARHSGRGTGGEGGPDVRLPSPQGCTSPRGVLGRRGSMTPIPEDNQLSPRRPVASVDGSPRHMWSGSSHTSAARGTGSKETPFTTPTLNPNSDFMKQHSKLAARVFSTWAPSDSDGGSPGQEDLGVFLHTGSSGAEERHTGAVATRGPSSRAASGAELPESLSGSGSAPHTDPELASLSGSTPSLCNPTGGTSAMSEGAGASHTLALWGAGGSTPSPPRPASPETLATVPETPPPSPAAHVGLGKATVENRGQQAEPSTGALKGVKWKGMEERVAELVQPAPAPRKGSRATEDAVASLSAGALRQLGGEDAQLAELLEAGGGNVVVTDCGHAFHARCLARHEEQAYRNQTMPLCPVCRSTYTKHTEGW